MKTATTPKRKLATTIESFLPVFPGFYETWFAPSEDNILENLKEDYPEANFDWDDCEFDYDEYRENTAKLCVNAIENQLKELGFKISIEYDGIYAPRFYNYTTDSINVTYTCSIATRKQIIKYLKANKEKFAKYCEENFKSRDGFNSFYSYDVNDWLTTYQYESLATTFGYILGFIFENEEYDHYQLYNDLNGQNNLDGGLKPDILETFETIKDYINLNYAKLSTDKLIENLIAQFEDNDISDNITPQFITRMVKNAVNEIENQTISLF